MCIFLYCIITWIILNLFISFVSKPNLYRIIGLKRKDRKPLAFEHEFFLIVWQGFHLQLCVQKKTFWPINGFGMKVYQKSNIYILSLVTNGQLGHKEMGFLEIL